MKIDTLGALLKAAERKGDNYVGAESPFQARAWIYEAMGDYMVQAEAFTRQDDDRIESLSVAIGGLVHVLAIDAQKSLAPEKFALLEGYPLTEAHHDLKLDKRKLKDALESTWAEEDIFIRRLSGGLFGSYIQALSTLKPHVRALGIDLSRAVTAHLNNL